MSEQAAYRRSLRHMNEDALRTFIKAELSDANNAVLTVNTKIQHAATTTSDSTDVDVANVSLELEELKEFLELTKPNNSTVLLINEIFETLKSVSQAEENELLSREISELCQTMAELHATVCAFRDTIIQFLQNKFSQLKSKACSTFTNCQKDIAKSPAEQTELEAWISTLARVEQEVINAYEDLRRWSDGKLLGSTRQDMDKISQDVRSLTQKINQLLSAAAEESNGEEDICRSEEEDSVKEDEPTSRPHTTPSIHSQSVKSAVSQTRALVEAMKKKTSSKEVDLLSSSSPDTHGGIELAKEFAQAIATSFAQSMELQRVPVPSLYVFNGDPLEYADWEIAFSAAVDKKGISEEEKMRHLQRSVGGPARKTIQRYFRLKSPNATKQARQALREKFGDDFKICDAYKKELDNWPEVDGKDHSALTDYSEFLQQCLITMEDVPALCSLNEWSEIRKVVDKLPDWLINQWKRKVTSYKRKHKVYPKLKDLAEFLQDEVEVSGTEVTTESRGTAAKPTINNKHKRSAALTVNSAENMSTEKRTTSQSPHKFCYNCEMTNHMTVDCGLLRRKPHADVVKLVIEKRLCYGCLRPGHSSNMCQNRAQCTKCSKRHPACLHTDEKPEEKKEVSLETVQTCGKVQSTTDSFTSAMIVPVWVSHKNKPGHELLTYAMLDTQSSSTFMLDNLFDKLKCPATETKLTITTLTSKKETTESMKISNLQVRGYRQSKKLDLPPTYTRQFIPFNKDHVPTRSKTISWPHLQCVENELEELFECDAGLLIGYDCMSALAPIETIRAEGNVPYAIKTELGWSIVGTVDQRESADKLGISHRVIMKESEAGHQLAFECKTTIKEKDVPNEITRILETDFTDIKDHTKTISMEDRSFLQQLSHTIYQDEENYVTMPLPFRERPTNLPDNQKMAEKRLQLLGRKFKSEPTFKQQYTEFMTNLFNQGHAQEVTEPGTKGESWFLPHFAVFHPKKPDKIRVVFDGSAKFKQQSINDHLLQGPDLLNGLLGVLLRFRAKKIAIMCDIEKMFYQFRVAEQDRDYFRFLWWDDKMETAKVYRMAVHLFGATSSPGCATFGLRYLAQKHQDTHPKAADFIQRSFYVDDGLISVSSEHEAKELIESARDLCKKGNIRLHKFVTNSPEVLETVPHSERSQNLQEATITTTTPTRPERALGVLWCVETDTFRFTMPVSKETHTRREILSLIASIYDPLGFLAPFTVVGKQILQELCRRKANWDSQLPSDLTSVWRKWTEGLHDLTELRIARSTMIEEDSALSEIHCFSDASTTGYGACAYLRQKSKEGEVKCSYLLGKARVAPLKMITIPRMELQAAVVATQLAGVIERELKDILPADTSIHYWCDSMIALNYIANDAKKFKVYIANRIQQIRDVSTPSQWHHIASGDNPADHASRGSEVKNIIPHWIDPPEFLRKSDIKLSTLELESATDKLPEARCLSASVTETPILLEKMEQYSKWESLVNAFTALIRTATWKKGQQLTHLQLREKAIRLIIKTAQNKLDNGHLKPLDPYTDEDGIMRVGGRLEHSSSLTSDLKHPAILPKTTHITKLIVQHYHRLTGHSGRGLTTATIRQNGYWITGLSTAVSTVIRNCVTCKKLRGKTETQKMADLPAVRTEAAAPFYYSGMDCFGPFYVKDGRRELKRYGLLFTCLTSRAVHIEMLDDLTTDAFLNSLRCLIAMRGNVRTLYSDQGTNFKGAQTELKRSMTEITEELHRELASKFGCEFLFNTPSSSHMGGVWERQIRTARQALEGLTKERHAQLTSSSLRTLFYEATHIINSRPLTVEDLNDPDSLPITPNHLLHFKSDVSLPPPGNFKDSDGYSRKQWRRIQHLANVFWKKWRLGYLQTLQHRQKWTAEKEPAKVGDVVFVMDANPLRNQWKLARVTEMIDSHDGRARRAKLILGNTQLDMKGKQIKAAAEIERPLNKLIILTRV